MNIREVINLLETQPLFEGATDFLTKAKGVDMKEAFRNAVEEARREHGNGGYTGSVAEKHTFVAIRMPEGKNPVDYAYELLNNGDSRIEDKWGPAGGIDLRNGEYLFFGFASE